MKPGRSTEFEVAFGRGERIISAAPRVPRSRLVALSGTPGPYPLLVGWSTLPDHTEGLRGSAESRQQREPRRPFYDPFPAVEHYESVRPSAGARL